MSEVGQKIIATVRAKAEADPDYIYAIRQFEDGSSGCVYVENGCPSCIVGFGLWDAGVLDASIESVEDNKYAFADWNRAQFPVMDDLDEDELLWLGSVQLEQDQGTAWGAAVAHADDLFGVL